MKETSSSSVLIRDLYTRMLLTRLVDEHAWKLHKQGHIQFVASCRGHEAAQVGSAICIEVGKDFTLPYYRDLGVVLTIGMTPYEVLHTYLHLAPSASDMQVGSQTAQMHWGYHKHNIVTGPAPVATQILHAAGIAFASKLRKADVVTVAYCGDGATSEADFLEGTRFAAQHQLPMVIICEQDCPGSTNFSVPSSSKTITALDLPEGLTLFHVDGSDVLAVYNAMCEAMNYARSGRGPLLLEIAITRAIPPESTEKEASEQERTSDPLLYCENYMKSKGLWDEDWAKQLYIRLTDEVNSALQDVLRESFRR